MLTEGEVPKKKKDPLVLLEILACFWDSSTGMGTGYLWKWGGGVQLKTRGLGNSLY